jgi:hypothetical protein
VLQAEWNRTREMVDGDVVSGPVPTLFSDKLEAAKAALANDPEKAFKDPGKILRKLIMHEYTRGLGHRAETKAKYDTYGYGI